jgi:hypothetical protein
MQWSGGKMKPISKERIQNADLKELDKIEAEIQSQSS